MAVSTTDTYSGPYAANGSTVEFPFTFKAASASEVAVFFANVPGARVDVSPELYTVGLSDTGGTVVFYEAPQSGLLYIESAPEFDQKIAFSSGQSYRPETVNEANDRAAIRDLALRRMVDRAPQAPVGGGFSGARFPILLPDGTWGWSLGTVDAQPAVIISLTPMQFGAVGDGVADDGDALNAMFDHIRSLIALNTNTAINVRGGQRVYRTTKSINVTQMAAWSLNVSDMLLDGHCTGKAVVDLIGTRGYVFSNVAVIGDKVNRPAVAFQMQRGTPGGFCDNASFTQCDTDGYFSRAAVHDYGQETTSWDHCTIFNRDHTARVAIHEGYSAHAMTSDYAPVMTGPTSFINKQFLNCDYRYLPADENLRAITNVSNAAQAVITAPGHAFQVGDEVCFQYVGGMPLMAGLNGEVMARTANTVTVDVDTSAMGAYSGGGSLIRRAEQSPVYIARTEGYSTESNYIVSYGQPPIEIGFPDETFPRCEHVHFLNILFEGSGQECAIRFLNMISCQMLGFSLTTYNAHQSGCLMEAIADGQVISIYAPRIESVNPLFDVPLFGNPDRFAAYGANILYPTYSLVAPEDLANFNGNIVSLQSGLNTIYVDDAVCFYGGRTKLRGHFSSGAATPTLGSNKPGTNGAPMTWVDIDVDGVAGIFPVWPKA